MRIAVANEARATGVFVVVDRDPVVATAIATAAAASGHGSRVCARTQDIFDACAEVPLAGVFLDLGTPWLSPFELIEFLRDPRRPAVPIVVAAGRDQLDDITRALRLGADDFVTRPVDADAVALRLGARSGAGLRSANFTPVSLRAVGELPTSRARVFCATCVTVLVTDVSSCPTCGTTRPVSGWRSVETSERRHLGAVVAGRYLLDRFVGSGSVGEVYRALDLYLGRHYAAKLFDLTTGARQLRETVEREVAALARLESPHVVRLYELHELQSGELLVITEFIEGCTLDVLVRRTGSLRTEAALDVARQAAQGLHEVHAAGMVHRDIKPSNLMVQQLPAAGRFVRVLDFGLVRVAGALEQQQGIYGTPLFAAPEQLVAGREVDGRADIFALGLVLAFMLTGQAPEPGSVEAIVADRSDRLSAALTAAAARQPTIASVAPLVLSMTDVDPALRPFDMHDVVCRIDDLAGGRLDTGAWSIV